MLVYDIAFMFGYFLPLIVSAVFAIIYAKSKAGWIWFGIGAALQGMAVYGAEEYTTTYFVALAVIVIIMLIRRNKKPIE